MIYFGNHKDSLIKANSKNQLIAKDFDIDSASKSSNDLEREGTVFVYKKATIDYEEQISKKMSNNTTMSQMVMNIGNNRAQ